ncbi:MAG TPA: hypothetical protein VGO11_09920 [Chthoniobacteraceae bacterium]|jgi:hypothetical protein|nr:hypothetical protein [Chthoniobacteraceae bacterium]
MNKTRTLVPVAVAALVALAAGVFVAQRPSRSEPARIVVARVPLPAPTAESIAEAPTPAPAAPEVAPESSPVASSPEPAEAAPPPPVVAPAPAIPAGPDFIFSTKDAPLDPLARAALSMVGADPDAEEYWLAAINDPSLPAEERQDLIEDLNEDGLSDPQHPTADDLPLILSRLRLIEDVREEAMDEVNADAFQEAYKDLLNLARLASGGRFP